MPHPLDRPIWSALNSAQASLAQGGPLALRFPSDVSPFAATADHSLAAIREAAAFVDTDEEIAQVEPDPPAPPKGVTEAIRGPLVQMLPVSFDPNAHSVVFEHLGETDVPEIVALARLTRPGPFRARTHSLGRFIGVRENGQLIAMAGERLRTDDFIEISAVCTHPDHRGRGLGAALFCAQGARILADGKTPFLHAYATNTPAIALYERLGFAIRREVTLAIWRKA